MTRRTKGGVAFAALLAAALLMPAAVRAQASMDSVPTDSTYVRARRLVMEGNGAEGRKLVDSMLARPSLEPSAYAEALYWHAALAATAADAERDYRQLIVEYPLHARTESALLQLAQLEMTRNDRPPATAHLQQFLRDFSGSPQRGRAGFWLARLLFEQGDVPRGCTALRTARAAIPAEDAELRNQVDFYASRCSGVPDAAAPARDSAQVAPPVAPSVAPPIAAPAPVVSPPPAPLPKPKAQSPRPDAKGSKPAFAVQVAAFAARADADALVKKLGKRGLKAHVTGSAKPFRVRVGSFATRAEAAAMQASLRKRGIPGYVTEDAP
ncbi:MAG: Sporulation protein [Gemmatimonadetes bacterium]|nr:Sporulation protein [Gemmatimonadota bacterium]